MSKSVDLIHETTGGVLSVKANSNHILYSTEGNTIHLLDLVSKNDTPIVIDQYMTIEGYAPPPSAIVEYLDDQEGKIKITKVVEGGSIEEINLKLELSDLSISLVSQ